VDLEPQADLQPHLLFFSRYYDNGDFLSNGATPGGKYAVPATTREDLPALGEDMVLRQDWRALHRLPFGRAAASSLQATAADTEHSNEGARGASPSPRELTTKGPIL